MKLETTVTADKDSRSVTIAQKVTADKGIILWSDVKVYEESLLKNALAHLGWTPPATEPVEMSDKFKNHKINTDPTPILEKMKGDPTIWVEPQDDAPVVDTMATKELPTGKYNEKTGMDEMPEFVDTMKKGHFDPPDVDQNRYPSRLVCICCQKKYEKMEIRYDVKVPTFGVTATICGKCLTDWETKTSKVNLGVDQKPERDIMVSEAIDREETSDSKRAHMAYKLREQGFSVEQVFKLMGT